MAKIEKVTEVVVGSIDVPALDNAVARVSEASPICITIVLLIERIDCEEASTNNAAHKSIEGAFAAIFARQAARKLS